MANTDPISATRFEPQLEEEAALQPGQSAQPPPSAFPRAPRYVVSRQDPITDSPTDGTRKALSTGESSSALGNQGKEQPPRRVVVIPNLPPPKNAFISLQKWCGAVVEVRGSEFDAELRDQTDRTRPRELATFALDEISDGDRSLLQVGAVFYWSIGYEVTPAGQRNTVSTIIFRRLPAWTKREIEAVQKESQEIRGLLGIEEDAARKTSRA